MLKCAPILIVLSVVSASSGAELKVVTEKNVPVPMRDGTVLRADVYRPDQGGPYPVLVHRTPYGKSPAYLRFTFQRFVKSGYIVVSQDVRGRFESDGTWESNWRFKTHDAEDGFDTVEWAAKLPGTTGQVGTFGGSNDALLQWRLAALRPPSLVAMSAYSIPGRRTDMASAGSIRPGRRLQWWINMSSDMRKRSGRQVSEAYRKIANLESQEYLWFLPWRELPLGFFEHEMDAVQYWLKNPHTDPWKLDEGVKEITVPNLDVVGWYDHANGDMLMYRTMAKQAKTERARSGSRILIGPWHHRSLGFRGNGDVDYGVNARVNIAALQIRWFDYWIKGHDNGIDQDAPVRIFIMGDNRWRDEEHWPLGHTEDRVLYLSGGGHANTPDGDGKLIERRPGSSNSDHYVYDPADPVATLMGTTAFTSVADQSPLAKRKDILVYQSAPLAQRIEVTGNPVVELYAASSAPDTDWVARLIDVAPDGSAHDISMGLVRARYRDGLDKPKLIEPGKVVKYTIRMNPTSNAFLPGHRIRLDITSSDFPNYDRNHNTAADQNADATLAKASQTVCHGGSQVSRVILPQVPNVRIDPKTLVDFAGKYKTSGETFSFAKEGDSLAIITPGEQPERMYAASESTFYKIAGEQFTFLRNVQGDVDRIFVHAGNDTTSGTRLLLTIRLASPQPESFVNQSAEVTLKAQTSAFGGAEVGRVEFLVDGSIISAETEIPYESTWRAAAKGVHIVTTRVFDKAGKLTDSDKVSVWVGVQVLERTVQSTEDDVEEHEDGSIYSDSSDLELTRDGNRGKQVIGLRFDNIAIPQGTTIIKAYAQFTANGVGEATTSLVIRGRRFPNASKFSQTKHDVSSRPATDASVIWSPPSWMQESEQSEKQRSPDLSRIIQQIVSQEDWKSGNALALVISGSGYRNAVAYDGDPRAAATLHIEYEP